MSADAQARFHDSVKRRSGLKERGFEIDSPYLADFETIIKQRGWQEFCKPYKATTMIVVHEFYANAFNFSCQVPKETDQIRCRDH